MSWGQPQHKGHAPIGGWLHPGQGTMQGPNAWHPDQGQGNGQNAWHPGGGHGGVTQQGHPNSPAKQSALDFLKSQLRQWGLESLYGTAVNLLHQGYAQNPQTLQLELQNTKEWKTRFAGNEIRKQNGLAEFSPAQYLSMESAYQGVLQKYGLPKGFYDQHSDFANLIGGNVSPAELDTRAQIAHDQYMNAPAAMRDLWHQWYGTKGDAIAGILDPKIATQIIQDRANAIAIGGAAAEQGLYADKSRAQDLAQHGVTQSQAQQGYAQIAYELPTDQQIAQRFGTTFDQQQAEDATLLNQGGATRKRQRLYGQEEGLFGERSSNNADSLGVSQSY